MPRRPSVKDVAQHAGVSAATVSYVLTGKDRVAPATRERVLRSIRELGYHRNRTAAALRTGSSDVMIVIIPDITNPFYSELVVGMEYEAAERGLSITLRNANLDANREHHYLVDALRSDATALLYAPFTPDALGFPGLTPLLAAGPPVVLVDEVVSNQAAASVQVDNAAGGRLVADHFADIGCRRSAVIGAPSGMPTSRHRIEAFVERATQRGIDMPSTAIATAHPRTGDATATALEIIGSDPRIDSFFAGDDLLAIRVVKELAQRDIRVPGDIAVCGFDDIPWCAMVTPELTTVRQPIREMGRIAVRLGCGHDAHPERDVTLPVELVIRNSTRR